MLTYRNVRLCLVLCAAGRSVLTMAETYNHFKVNEDKYQHAASELVYMEGLSLAEQVPICATHQLPTVDKGVNHALYQMY